MHASEAKLMCVIQCRADVFFKAKLMHVPVQS